MIQNPAQAKHQNASEKFEKQASPEASHSALLWEEDVLRHVGYRNLDMTIALSRLDPALKESFKQAVSAFSSKRDYTPRVMMSSFNTINAAMRRFTLSTFDTSSIAKSLEIKSFVNQIGSIRSFFVFWKARTASAITDEALELLLKTTGRCAYSSNVLSDDPEKSWLSDEEYETLLATAWRNYEDGVFNTDRTFLVLLAMQFARRATQLVQLKIKDFRIAMPGDISGLKGPVVSFPGAKDLTAETGFRDSKFEHHPLPDHLWDLFEIHRKEVRALFEAELNTNLSDAQCEELPVFTTKRRIKQAASLLTDHYRVDLHNNLDHHLFHMIADVASDILRWLTNRRKKMKPPLSHRTGQPLVVSATRLRHTRARQLARKGVPSHVLSQWLGHTYEGSIKAYYDDPAEDARKLDETISPALTPLAMAFAGNLIDREDQATRHDDPTSRLEFAGRGELKNVGNCGKHSFCATTSVPIPCYRCRHFEPLVSAPHEEVLEALRIRQEEENQALRVGGARNLLIPIDLSADILAVKNCINRCNARKKELGIA